MSIQTPLNRVLGLGSAKDGVHHWWSQRLSSIALIPLTVLFLIPFVSALGAPLSDVRAIYASPFNAIVAILFIAVTFQHLAQGLQVVIEDYVHEKPARTTLLVLNSLLCALMGVGGVFAVAKLAFGA